MIFSTGSLMEARLGFGFSWLSLRRAQALFTVDQTRVRNCAELVHCDMFHPLCLQSMSMYGKPGMVKTAEIGGNSPGYNRKGSNSSQMVKINSSHLAWKNRLLCYSRADRWDSWDQAAMMQLHSRLIVHYITNFPANPHALAKPMLFGEIMT